MEAVEVDAGVRVAGRDWATGTGVAAFQMDLADFETKDAAFVFSKQLIFPEGSHAGVWVCV